MQIANYNVKITHNTQHTTHNTQHTTHNTLRSSLRASLRAWQSIQLLILLLILTTLLSCGTHSPNQNDRYVVLSPELAEILSFIGVEDRIVGITAECDYPESLKNKEIIGNFGNISIERIIRLNPTKVFASALEHDLIVDQLNKLNIPVVQLYPRNSDDLINAIRYLGEITDTSIKADSLATDLEQRFTEFRELANIHTNKTRVYIEIYGNPIMSADNTSFVGQLLLYVGVENIFPSLIRDYARVSPEDVVRANPDVIILTYPGVSAEDVRQRMGWSVINAVKNNRIYTIDDINPDLILRASPRNVQGIEAIKQLVIGNLFSYAGYHPALTQLRRIPSCTYSVTRIPSCTCPVSRMVSCQTKGE